MADNSASSGGVGFCGLLAVVLIALKLAHTIAWSWWWVLAPLWVPTALFIAGALVVVAVGALRRRTRRA